nr:NADH dehydrogenase subunit 6 [Michalowskiya breviprocessa]
MKMMMMKFMIVISSVISMLKSPMSMGMMLLLQTMMMIMLMNLIMVSSWFTMITFLMMIGGLLILFTYMSSIASNEKFKLKINLTMIMIILLMLTDEMMINWQINENQELMELDSKDYSLTKLYNKKSMIMTIMLVMYLLLTMISVSKIVKHHEGPLRSFKKYE